MTLVHALSALVAMKASVFHTNDAAARLGVANAHASTILRRLAASRHLVRLRRGVWAFADRVDPLALPEHLTSPFPSYVSLQSALYLHDMISQVPAVTYAVSLARTRRFTTPLGTVSVHHVDPAFFFGFEDAGRGGVSRRRRRRWSISCIWARLARGSSARCRSSSCPGASACASRAPSSVESSPLEAARQRGRLLASARLDGAKLWTLDRRLRRLAQRARAAL